LLTLWCTLSALTLGVLVLMSDSLELAPLMLILGYLALGLVGFQAAALWFDLFNPVTLVLFVGSVRYALSATLFAATEVPDEGLFRVLGLDAHDWQLGHVLAVTGMLGTAAGWLLLPRTLPSVRLPRIHLPSGTAYVAPAGMVLGLLFFILFVSSNVALDTAVVEGTFRGTPVQEGTGNFFFLSLMLISSSVILTGYLLAESRWPTWLSLTPVIFSTLCYFVLGGRARAIESTVAGLLVAWYVGLHHKGGRRPSLRRIVFWGTVGAIFFTWFGYLGQLYRTGLGLDALAASVSPEGLRAYYTEDILLLDVGNLHSLAAAAALGPGALEGRSFLGALSWPLSTIFYVPGKSAGLFIVQSLVGPSEGWGLHPSLAGEAYLNFGAFGVVAVTALFGFVMKYLYVKFRSGRLPAPLYVLVAIYSFRIYLESMDKWGETLVVAAFALATLKAAELLTMKGHLIARSP
jgi:hypothetical protein